MTNNAAGKSYYHSSIFEFSQKACWSLTRYACGHLVSLLVFRSGDDSNDGNRAPLVNPYSSFEAQVQRHEINSNMFLPSGSDDNRALNVTAPVCIRRVSRWDVPTCIASEHLVMNVPNGHSKSNTHIIHVRDTAFQQCVCVCVCIDLPKKHLYLVNRSQRSQLLNNPTMSTKSREICKYF